MHLNTDRCQAGRCYAYRLPHKVYCLKHFRRWDRHGDPHGHSIRACDLHVHLRAAARAIKGSPDQAAVNAALKSAEALLNYTSRYTASARHVSASVAHLRARGVTPLQLLRRVVAWRLFADDNAHTLPRSPAANRIALGRHVLMMARSRVKPVPGMIQPKRGPLGNLSTVQLRIFGAALQVTFRALPVLIAEHFNRADAT